MHKLLLIAGFALATSGCAVGVKHQYDNVQPQLKVATGSKVAVGVQDARSYVVTNNKPETFVGVQRGGFGNPFDVNTESGKPLASDFVNVIAASLKRSGATVTAVELSPKLNDAGVKKALMSVGTGKAVLVVLREWKSDTMTNTALLYDLSLSVMSAGGDVLATKKLAGTDDLGGSIMNPPGHAREVVPVAFRKKLEELFADPAVVRALQ
jgi:hypothetical protein